MLQSLTTEMLMTGGVVAASILAITGAVVILRSPRPEPRRVDVERAVRNAPYHRLHNVLPVKGK